jgi:NADPH-dependent 7-cyano-7-deazaguanine reductase QueF-like protein
MAGTVNSTFIRNGGDHHVAVGTIEVTTTAQEFNIVSDSSYVLYCNIVNQDGVDATHQVTLNSDNGTIDSELGSVWIDGSNASDTYAYHLGYV